MIECVLDEPGRRRHVVPGGVAAEHALVEAELGREGPLGDYPGCDADGDQQRPRRDRRSLDRLDVRGANFQASAAPISGTTMQPTMIQPGLKSSNEPSS